MSRGRWLRVFAPGYAAALLLLGSGTPAPAHAAGSGPVSPRAESDFDGDGHADLAVSALFEDVETFQGPAEDAGAVNVVYGGPGGLQTANPPAQFWSQESPGVQDQADPDDQFGFALGFGDFNGDALSDLAIGVPHEAYDPGTGLMAEAGAVEVLYGSPTGLQADGSSGAPSAQYWTETTPGVPGVAAFGNNFGRSLAGGDFDHDGFADLAIDIRGEDAGGQSGAGAVDVLYGGAAGLQVVSPLAQQWVQGRDGVQDAPEAHDWFGRNLTAGDFDGDGFEDLAAGVFLEDLGSIKDAGGVEVLYGSANGLQADGIGGPDDQLWTQDSPSVKDRSERGDYFGHTVASGDFNADGFDDLAVASRLEDAGAVPDSGSVEVLYGSPLGLLASAHQTTPDDQSWSLGSPDLQGESEAGDQWGFSLATGDFDGEGHDDLAVGAPFRDVAGPGGGMVGDAGVVSVLFGGPESGLQGIDPDDQMWTRDSPGVQDRPGVGDVFGYSLAAGDSNADGASDLAIGVLADDIALTHVTNAGSVVVLYAKEGVGLQAFDPDDQLWTQDALGIAEDGSETKDDFGWALA